MGKYKGDWDSKDYAFHSGQSVKRWVPPSSPREAAVMTQFVVDHGEARLVYFHPPGVYFYQDAAAQWLAQTAALRSSGKFRWYTMSGLARFLSQRELPRMATVWTEIDGDTLRLAAADAGQVEVPVEPTSGLPIQFRGSRPK